MYTYVFLHDGQTISVLQSNRLDLGLFLSCFLPSVCRILCAIEDKTTGFQFKKIICRSI
jgi:hypothetical protein